MKQFIFAVWIALIAIPAFAQRKEISDKSEADIVKVAKRLGRKDIQSFLTFRGRVLCEEDSILFDRLAEIKKRKWKKVNRKEKVYRISIAELGTYEFDLEGVAGVLGQVLPSVGSYGHQRLIGSVSHLTHAEAVRARNAWPPVTQN